MRAHALQYIYYNMGSLSFSAKKRIKKDFLQKIKKVEKILKNFSKMLDIILG